MSTSQPKPPTSNTGVITANPQKETEIKIDWLQVTFPVGVSLEFVQALFMGGDWATLERGMYGYRRSVVKGNIRILYDGAKTDMGIHAILSGQGCRELEGYSMVGWQQFLGALLTDGSHITRLDVAIDDYAHILDYATIRKSVADRAITTRYRQFREQISEKLGTAEDIHPGRTMYFGSSKSETMIRIYDKGAEQGEEVERLRVELQTRDEKAMALAREIVEQGPAAIPPIINGLLCFKEKNDGDQQRDRWAAADWWALFLGTMEKVGLTVEPVTRTLEKLITWVAKQVAPSLAVLMCATKGDDDLIFRLIEEGLRRLTKSHRAMILREYQTPEALLALAQAAA